MPGGDLAEREGIIAAVSAQSVAFARDLAPTSSVLGSLGLAQKVYDAVGRVTSVKDANGHVQVWEYDALGRITKQTDGEGFGD